MPVRDRRDLRVRKHVQPAEVPLPGPCGCTRVAEIHSETGQPNQRHPERVVVADSLTAADPAQWTDADHDPPPQARPPRHCPT
jgi:hypothetical protein